MLVRLAAAAVALSIFVALPVAADSWKDESGKGRERGEWKQEYRDGACKIERKWERGGAYKEEVKCDGRHAGYLQPPVVVIRSPVVEPVQLPPPPQGPSYGEVYRDASGHYCREYQTTGIIEGRRQPLYGTVCLQPDGSWAFSD